MQSSGHLQPLHRERISIRPAKGFVAAGERRIREEAIDRTLKALKEFANLMDAYRVDTVLAVSTGVIRQAVNREHFLNLLYELVVDSLQFQGAFFHPTLQFGVMPF